MPGVSQTPMIKLRYAVLLVLLVSSISYGQFDCPPDSTVATALANSRVAVQGTVLSIEGVGFAPCDSTLPPDKSPKSGVCYRGSANRVRLHVTKVVKGTLDKPAEPLTFQAVFPLFDPTGGLGRWSRLNELDPHDCIIAYLPQRGVAHWAYCDLPDELYPCGLADNHFGTGDE